MVKDIGVYTPGRRDRVAVDPAWYMASGVRDVRVLDDSLRGSIDSRGYVAPRTVPYGRKGGRRVIGRVA